MNTDRSLDLDLTQQGHLNDISFKIIGASELEVRQQSAVSVFYDGRVVGDYVPDLLVSDCVVVEVKATEAVDRVYRAQCINYLRATGFRLCLLLNFGRPRLQVARFALRS